MLQEFSHCPQCLSLRQVQLLPLQQQQLTHHCCPQLSASFVVSCQFPPLCLFHSRRLIYISNHFARHSERSTNVEILLHNEIVISKDKKYCTFVGPYAESMVPLPMANSSRFVLPTTIAPASCDLWTTVAVYGAVKLSNIFEPQEVLVPATQKLSLTAIGIPEKYHW